MKYTAITIGPIFRTLEKTRSTKSIWSASYLFSYLMKQIYKEVIQEIDKDKILLPYVANELLEDNLKLKAGLFPDRIIFEGELKSFDTLRRSVIEDLANIISKDIKKEVFKIERYLQKYLTIKSIIKEIDASKVNAVEIMDNLLNIQELQQQAYVSNDNENSDYLKEFLEHKERDYNTFINDEFGGQPFQSIHEIATALLNHSVSDKGEDKQEDFYRELKETNENYKPIHKYIAIVQADGDNIGSLIKALSETSENFKKDIQTFSERLYNFSREALDIIKKWKGIAIFAGGDDLLFFAPIAYVEDKKIDKTILEVCREISCKFNELITKEYQYLNLDKQPSISFGINISYYKFPLGQALHLAYSQLVKAKNGGRNAIAFNITKHSGRAFGTVFKQNSKVFELINSFLSNKDRDEFISNFVYRLDSLKKILEEIGAKDKSRNERFGALFQNYFDEDIHKKSNENGFLKDVRELLELIYSENPLTNCCQDEKEKRNKQNIEKLYSTLRYYQFIYNKKE